MQNHTESPITKPEQKERKGNLKEKNWKERKKTHPHQLVAHPQKSTEENQYAHCITMSNSEAKAVKQANTLMYIIWHLDGGEASVMTRTSLLADHLFQMS